MLTLLLFKQNLFFFVLTRCEKTIGKDAISLYLLSRVNKFKKTTHSLARKKQPVKDIRENSCMLKEAAATSYS